MRNLAAIALLVSGCGGESFSSELFTAPVHEDGGGVPESGPIVSLDAAAPEVREDAPACERWAIRLPGDDGSYAVLPGAGQLYLPFSVALDVKITESGAEVRLEMDGPENPCGWSLTVRGTQVKTTVPAVFDHYTSEGVVGAGWHRVGWRYDGQQSVVSVDGAEVSRAPKPAGGPFPGCSGPARVEGEGAVDRVSAGAEWLFDEESGAALLPQGELIGRVARECR